jgi:hypothetical protein
MSPLPTFRSRSGIFASQGGVSAASDPGSQAGEGPPARRLSWQHALYLAPLVIGLILTGWHAWKPMPPGTHLDSPWMSVPSSDISFITDVTVADAYGQPVINQAIFDESLRIVSQAQTLLVLDYHLFGDLHASEPRLRPLAAQLRDALIARKRALPQLTVLLITDPLNELHGHASAFELSMLQAGGISVVTADLDQLRDANFMYSALWRLGIRWWAGTTGDGWLSDPTDSGEAPVSFGAWAQLLNFKADQRRVLIGDDGHGALVGLVGSADPHQASSQHSNAALRLKGPALAPLLASEVAIARLSGWTGALPKLPPAPAHALPTHGTPAAAAVRVQVLTEGAIGEALLAQVNNAAPADTIDIAALYLSDRDIIDALQTAARRGVKVRVILDPGKDGFGRVRTGLPNQPSASELVSQSDGKIRVRWYRTHGEQFHARVVMIHSPSHQWLLVGSADLTRHALSDYHLEADIAVDMAAGSQLALQSRNWFNTLWDNHASPGTEYTADFALYADPAQSHYWLYRFLEWTGWAAF